MKALDSLNNVLKTTDDLKEIQEALLGQGFAQYEINQAVKVKIDEGYDVLETKGQFTLVMV